MGTIIMQQYKVKYSLLLFAVLELRLLLSHFTEELGSDEDDIDEDGQEYLEILAKQAGEDGDDEDWEEDDAEETALEGYSTIIDDEDNPVDEYQIFKAIFQSTITVTYLEQQLYVYFVC